LISPYRIKFRNKTNTDFDLIVGATFDSDNGNVTSFLNKASISSSVYDGSRKNVHGYHYTDIMNVSFTLIKHDYTDITDNERRKIYAWLTGSNNVEELVIYKDDSEVISYRLIGGFTNIEHYKLDNGRDVGVVVNFEHIAPYAYSPVKTVTKLITAPQSFTVNCQTDVYEKKLFPRITVVLGESKFLTVLEDPTVNIHEMIPYTVYRYTPNPDDASKDQYFIRANDVTHKMAVTPNAIENQTADRSTVGTYCLSMWDNNVYKGIYTNNKYGWTKVVTSASFEITNIHDGNVVAHSIVTGSFPNEIITLDGDNKIISSSRTPMRIMGESFNWEWIYLLPGENEISVHGNVDITIEWVEPIKIGNV
jgi:hypothetical protein